MDCETYVAQAVLLSDTKNIQHSATLSWKGRYKISFKALRD